MFYTKFAIKNTYALKASAQIKLQKYKTIYFNVYLFYCRFNSCPGRIGMVYQNLCL